MLLSKHTVTAVHRELVREVSRMCCRRFISVIAKLKLKTFRGSASVSQDWSGGAGNLAEMEKLEGFIKEQVLTKTALVLLSFTFP